MARRSDLVFTFSGLALAIVTVIAFWVVDYLPTNDGPDHAFAGYIENHWQSLDERDRAFVLLHGQLTAHGFRVVYVPLERWLGWRDALRTTETVWALVFALGVLTLFTALAPGRRWLGLLGFPAAFQWSLYMGLISYWAAIGVGLTTLAVALRSPRWRLFDRFVVASLLFFTALLHVFPSLLVGATLGVAVLVRAERRALLRELGALALMSAPTLAVVMLTLVAGQGSDGVVDDSTFASRLALAPQVFAVGPVWRWVPFFALALVGYGTGLARLRALSPAERALVVVGPICLGLATFSPTHLEHWQFFSPRFIALGVIFGIALVRFEALAGAARRAAACSLCLFCALALGWSVTFHRDLASACAPALAGLKAPVHRSGYTVFLPLRGCYSETPVEHVPYVPRTAPLWKAASLYAIVQGGLSSALHGVPELHSLTLLSGPITPQLFLGGWARRWEELISAPGPRTPERERDAFVLVTEMAEKAATNDNLVVYGRRAERMLILERGFVTDWEDEWLSLAHFVGCPFEVELPPGWASALVEYGWWPHADPLVRLRSRERSDDAVRVTLPRSPCGPIWIRVTADDGRHCAGADADGISRDRSGGEGAGSLFRCTAAPRGQPRGQ
jgi:hypothetical protein